MNNRIHDTPHDALRLLESTACTIEENEIYNAVNDTYDAGAVYSNGGVFKGVGSIFKNNYFHDIRLSQYSKGGSTVALYWDDEQSGMTSVGNIFDDVAFGMLVGGGDWNTVNNNIFYKSRASMTVDSRGESWSTSGRAGALEGYVSRFKKLNDKMNYEVVDIGDWLKNKDNWVTKSNSLKKGDLLHVSLSDPETPEANATYTGAQLTGSQLLKFKAKVDFTGYQMWGFNTDNTTEHAWGSLGYSIVVFRDRFEVQKRYKENGNIVAQILKTYANEESIMTSDVWHTIETGVLSTVMGPRILVKVDGKTIVDYTDEAKPAANEAGWFKFTEQSGGIGITVAPADYIEE